MPIKIVLTLNDDIDKITAELAIDLYLGMSGVANAEVFEEQHCGKCVSEVVGISCKSCQYNVGQECRRHTPLSSNNRIPHFPQILKDWECWCGDYKRAEKWQDTY